MYARSAVNALVLSLFSSAAFGQVAIVQRNVNLRQDPSSGQQSIRLLTPPEELTLLSLTRMSGYYNVFTDADEEGWVWGRNIRVDESRPGAIVSRNVNLRQDPSTANPPIRLLPPGEELLLVDRHPTNRYYHVRTRADEEGWVWGSNIDLADLPPTPPPLEESRFPDAHDPPPAGWTGPVFKLSQDYPATPTPAEPMPWKQFNFRTQSEQYIRAVFDYALEGNREVDWLGQNNAVRKWYHVPWLHTTANGREFVHGLTRERSSRPRELHPQQTTTFRNYAVGLYNAPGGHVIGQVWSDSENPDASAARFPDGTVAIKLLFSSATVDEVPYIQNSLEWDAHIALTGTARSINTVRLLQIDVAVRDSRADSTTGWVFGTFSYDGNVPGATPWDRMVPIGLMWGNDPTLTPARFAAGDRATESVIINRDVGTTQHLGWLERLNGPVDNPRSSCLSCHATAQHESITSVVPGASLPDSAKMRWFRNVPATTAFDAGQVSLDYSLQLSEGLERFFDARRPPNR